MVELSSREEDDMRASRTGVRMREALMGGSGSAQIYAMPVPLPSTFWGKCPCEHMKYRITPSEPIAPGELPTPTPSRGVGDDVTQGAAHDCHEN